MLAAFEWITVIGEAANGIAAVESINTLKPELVFLDVQMPGLIGTEVITRITHQPFVVFTTAFGEHAVTAFELGAVDYLLKPFGPDRLASAMERVRAALGEPAPLAALDRLGEALSKGPLSRLFVRSGTAIVPSRSSRSRGSKPMATTLSHTPSARVTGCTSRSAASRAAWIRHALRGSTAPTW